MGDDTPFDKASTAPPLAIPRAEEATRPHPPRVMSFFQPDEIAKTTFDPSDAVDFWDLVNRQDWTVCERVELGLKSRVHQFGYYAPMEDLAADIRRYVDKHLGPPNPSPHLREM